MYKEEHPVARDAVLYRIIVIVATTAMLSIHRGILASMMKQTAQRASGSFVASSSKPERQSHPNRAFSSRRRSGLPRRRNARKPQQLIDVPSMDICQVMPINYRKLDNTALSTLGAMGDQVQALEEMLKRHIMATDRVDYHTASQIFLKIEAKNHEMEFAMAFPFQLGIIVCGVGGFLAVPLVFHLPTVEWFNENFVTAEHPRPEELQTALEVGSWSWNWMVRGFC